MAFSAALRESGSGDTGPFTTATPLQYKRVFSNAGSNYNSATGSDYQIENGLKGRKRQMRTCEI